jgi:hypothetical protein
MQVSTKKFSLFVSLTAYLVVLAVILFNFCVDPFQIYRAATLYNFKIQNQRYLNAGLLKNYPYKSAIVGSSMVENFYISDVENLLSFPEPIKLPIQGASAFEINTTLNSIIENKKISHVLYGLDIYAYSSDTTYTKNPSLFPVYLYDNTISNDLPYLLNFDTLKRSISSLKESYDADQISENFQNMYNWQNFYKTQFNEFSSIQNYVKLHNGFKKSSKQNQSKIQKKFHFEILKNNFDIYALPLIQNNPQIHFEIFYPPYSVLSYQLMHEQGYFEEVIKFKHYIYQQFNQYSNVSLYDFQVAQEITTQLNHYKDISHYNEDINHWILLQIKNENFLVTNENINETLKKFLTYTLNYKVVEKKY